MAVTYPIAENHGGRISADSEINQRTPLKPSPPTKDARKENAEGPEPELERLAETVLLIEDEDLVMEVNRAIFEKLGYNVLGARSGKEAVHLARTFAGDIDLAILDIVLPDMNGKEIYPLLMEARPALKVIVSSGYSSDGPAQDILDAGAQKFIQKPFSMEKLAAVIKEVSATSDPTE